MTDEMREILDKEVKNEKNNKTNNNISDNNNADTNTNTDVAIVETEPKEVAVSDDASQIIASQRERDLKIISEQDEFKKASGKVNERDVIDRLKQKSNEISDKELDRQLEEYKLKKKKEELDYRTKLEKHLTKQSVQADIYNKKREIAQTRYGYLYKDNLKDFTPNKSLNRLKEFKNWYKSLSDDVHKIISTTLKWIVRLGLSVGGVFALYGLLKWLLNNGLVNIIN